MKKNTKAKNGLIGAIANRRDRHPDSKILMLADAKTEIGLERWVAQRRYAVPDATLGDVAEEIGVSQVQLSFYFRVILGIRFSTWRKRIRIRDAKILLIQEPDKSLASIGEAVGIADKSDFRRQFREIVGMSPAEYREKLLGLVEE